MAHLTHGELEVMKILWEDGELNPMQIEERFARPIKNAALRFQLRILMEKGHVERRKVGRFYVYRALTPHGGTFRKMARRLADVFFSGSAAGLIAELMRSEDLTPQEADELRRIAQSRATRPTSKPLKKSKGGPEQ